MANREKDRLDVPLLLQDNSYFCVPACLKMVYDYFNKSILMERIAELSIDDIARIVHTNVDGTKFGNVDLLNEATVAAVPSMEFDAEYASRKFPDIEAELYEGRPVIAWVVVSPDGVHDFVHSVVITGIDKKNQKVYYNDPVWGKNEESIGSFLEKWEKTANIIVKVQIGKKQRKVLEEWMPREIVTGRHHDG